MDPKTHMLQDESKGEPLPQVESEVGSTTDVFVNEGVCIEEEKLVKAKIGLGEDICTAGHMEGSESTKQVDVEAKRVEILDDEVVNFEENTYVVSLSDKFINETRGDKGADRNIRKLENKDGHSQVGHGDLLVEKGDKYPDTIDNIGEGHLLFEPTKEDMEVFNIPNVPFMSDTLLLIESDMEPTTQLPGNEGISMKEEKFFKAEIALGENKCAIEQMEGSRISKQVDVEETRANKNDDEVVSFEDMTYVVSQNDIFTNDTRGDKGIDINVAQLDTKDGESEVGGENAALLEETHDKYHDTKDIIDENHLLFAPNMEYCESELFNISNNSLMFDPLLHIESDVEPTDDVSMNEVVDISEERSVMVEIGLGETRCINDQIEGIKNTRQVDVDMERMEEKDNEVLSFEDKAYVVSLNDKVISETKGDKGSDINIRILEKRDVLSKVDGENGASLQDKGYKYHDNGGNYPLFAPIKDNEGISFFSMSNNSFMFDNTQSNDDSGTEQEQEAFLKELEKFHKNNSMEFKPPKFYGEVLNYLKLWRQVARLGGYDQVTSRKMWRQVGDSFNPPRTCTNVSWSFRNFYEKVLLEYEKHKKKNGKFKGTTSTLAEQNTCEKKEDGRNVCGRVRRESASRAMQSWHSRRPQRNGSAKRKRIPADEDAKDIQHIPDKRQDKSMVIDAGPPADWVKINVLRTKDSYEVYALVPGLVREELRVQSDPAGRLIITGQPAEEDNPWDITRFKKVIILPSRIDPSQTSAYLNLHGRLYVSAAPEKPKSQ